MGRGDNRRTRKVIQRKQWRRKKARLRLKIEEGKSALKNKSKVSKATDAGPATVRRPG